MIFRGAHRPLASTPVGQSATAGLYRFCRPALLSVLPKVHTGFILLVSCLILINNNIYSKYINITSDQRATNLFGWHIQSLIASKYLIPRHSSNYRLILLLRKWFRMHSLPHWRKRTNWLRKDKKNPINISIKTRYSTVSRGRSVYQTTKGMRGGQGRTPGGCVWGG